MLEVRKNESEGICYYRITTSLSLSSLPLFIYFLNYIILSFNEVEGVGLLKKVYRFSLKSFRIIMSLNLRKFFHMISHILDFTFLSVCSLSCFRISITDFNHILSS